MIYGRTRGTYREFAWRKARIGGFRYKHLGQKPCQKAADEKEAFAREAKTD
ncbi:MAG: hypothetical protein V3U62_03030 [Sedimenticolaceae bacterium]